MSPVTSTHVTPCNDPVATDRPAASRWMVGARLKRRGRSLLRRIVPGHANDAGRRLIQLNQLQVFETVLRRHGRSLRQCRSILEFGCGYGRLTRHLFTLAPQAEIFGCDVSARDIAFCRRAYPQGRFTVNQPTPPLHLPDAQCDFIFSYSVFTHLSEENHKHWLQELARILRPDGVMVHTTHSVLSLRLIEMFSPERLSKYGLGGSVEAFAASGQAYHYAVDDPAQPEYGLTVISPAYILQQWPACSGLRVLEHVEGAMMGFPEGCQDLVVLAKGGG